MATGKIPASSPTVLLADNDQSILAALSEGLRAAGFRTIEASSGSAALQLCADTPPSIAILGSDMPDMSGVEIARALKESSAFPLILLSADADDAMFVHAADAGAMACLILPVGAPQLISTIRTALRRFSELSRLRGESAQLTRAIQSTRDISTVVGLLMARLQVSDKDAYDRLRQYARSQNRKVVDIASEILTATAMVNRKMNDIASMIGTHRDRPERGSHH